jgi:hypothetical protein
MTAQLRRVELRNSNKFPGRDANDPTWINGAAEEAISLAAVD